MDGSISFNMSSIPLFFLLSYFENHCNLSSPEINDLCVFLCVCVFFDHLNLNPHLYTGKVFALTSVPAVCHFTTFSLCVCPSSLLSATAGLGDHVCGMCLFHSVAQEGIASDLGML